MKSDLNEAPRPGPHKAGGWRGRRGTLGVRPAGSDACKPLQITRFARVIALGG